MQPQQGLLKFIMQQKNEDVCWTKQQFCWLHFDAGRKVRLIRVISVFEFASVLGPPKDPKYRASFKPSLHSNSPTTSNNTVRIRWLHCIVKFLCIFPKSKPHKTQNYSKQYLHHVSLPSACYNSKLSLWITSCFIYVLRRQSLSISMKNLPICFIYLLPVLKDQGNSLSPIRPEIQIQAGTPMEYTVCLSIIWLKLEPMIK